MMCLKIKQKINITAELENRIIEALEKSTYRWRTAEGIARELRLDQTLIFNHLFNSEKIIIAHGMNKRGEQLFALREKYFKEIPLKVKIINAITGEIH